MTGGFVSSLIVLLSHQGYPASEKSRHPKTDQPLLLLFNNQ